MPHFVIADGDPQARGFDHGRFLLDQLLENLLFEAQLPQQLLVDVLPVRGAVRLQLVLVRPGELGDRDAAAVDPGHLVSG